MNYKVQAHLKPKALSGISNDQISQLWKLYEGYVENANRLIEGVARAEAGSSPWAELKRRLGFEVDGVVLHEYYFGNLACGSTLRPAGDLAADLGAAWGSVRASSHEQGHPAGFHPVLVLDVFEHAYLVGFGAGGRAEYVAAFLARF